MKQLTCEMCGSTDLLKQDGVFICQSCGTKYTVEEAKKMMIEGTVEVQGTVKLDNSDKLKKLYQAARNARETSDSRSAIKYYEQITAEDPDSWEALFYLVILKSEHITNAEIRSAANSITVCLPKVFELIKTTVADEDEQKQAVLEVGMQCADASRGLADASYNFYKSVTKGNGTMAVLGGVSGLITSSISTAEADSEESDRCIDIANINVRCGNLISTMFNMDDKDWQQFAICAWKEGLEHNLHYKKLHHTNLMNIESRKMIASNINRYDPDFTFEFVEQVSREQTLPKSATSPQWGSFMTIMCWICAFLPVSGLIVSGATWYSINQGQMTNVKKETAQTTLWINIVVTILILLIVAANS